MAYRKSKLYAGIFCRSVHVSPAGAHHDCAELSEQERHKIDRRPQRQGTMPNGDSTE